MSIKTNYAENQASAGEFLYSEASSQAHALTQLSRVVAEDVRIAVLTGAEGVGKSTVCARFIETCPPAVSAARIDAALTSSELHRRLVNAFGLAHSAAPGARPMEAFFGFLLDQRLQGRKVVLFLDDAHKLSGDVINTLRVLTHLNLDDDRLLHVVLVGNPHLEDLLRSGEFDAIRPGIGLQLRIDALTRDETAALARAALAIDPETALLGVTDDAFALLHRYGAGNVGALRLLLDLAAAFTLGKDLQTLNAPAVWEAIQTPDWVARVERLQGLERPDSDIEESLASAPCVAVFHAGNRIAQIEVKRESAIFGRAPSCEIRTDDGSVSRTHARLSFADDTVLLRDLHSQNGTSLNGRRIDEAPVRDGDVIRFGKISAIFFYKTLIRPVPAVAAGYSPEESEEDRRLEAQLEELFFTQATTETRSTVVPLRPPEPGPQEVAAMDIEFVEAASSLEEPSQVPELVDLEGIAAQDEDAPHADPGLMEGLVEDPLAFEVPPVVEPVAEPELKRGSGTLVLPLLGESIDAAPVAEPVVQPLPGTGVLPVADEAGEDFGVAESEWDGGPESDFAIEIELPAGLDLESATPESLATLPVVAAPEAADTLPVVDELDIEPESTPPAAEHREVDPTGGGTVREQHVVYRVDKPFFTIGREVENDLCIDSNSVSRAHALVVYTEGELWVEDLDSANGTFINAERIEKAALRNADFLRVGDRMFRYVAPASEEVSGDLGELHSISSTGWSSDRYMRPASPPDGAADRGLRLAEPGNSILDAQRDDTALAPPAASEDRSMIALPPAAAAPPTVPGASRRLKAAIWVSAGLALTGLYIAINRHERPEQPAPVAVERAVTPIRALPETGVVPPAPSIALSPEVLQQTIAPETTTVAPAPSVSALPPLAGVEPQRIETIAPTPVTEPPVVSDSAPAALPPGTPETGIAALLDSGAETPPLRVTPNPDRQTVIEQLLAQGQRQLAANRLATPAKDNAIATYNRVLRLDPANGEARRGLSKIAGQFQQLAAKQKEQGQYASSLASIDRGLSADRNSAELDRLRSEVSQLASGEQKRAKVAERAAPPAEPPAEPEIEAPFEQPPMRVTVKGREAAPAARPDQDLPIFVSEPSQPAPAPAVNPEPPIAAAPAAAPEAPPAQVAKVIPPASAAAAQQPAKPARAAPAAPAQPASADAQKSKGAEQLQRQVNQMQLQRLVNQAREHHDAEDYDGSLELIDQGLAIEARNLELLSMRDQVLQRKASSDQRAADKTGSTIVGGLVAQAKQRRADGQLGESLKLIESALAIQPKNRELQQLKALVQKDING